MRILLVDDDVHLTSLEKILLRRGYEVELARCAEQAIAILQKDKQFDLVVTDYSMYHKNGCELIAYVKRKMPKATTILMSGHSESDIRAANPDCAYDYFSQKGDPNSIRKMLDIIAEKKT